MAIISNDLHKALELLREDEVVAIPTETVYGLAANALSEAAVTKIFEAKNRPTFDPLIVHVSSIEQIRTITTAIPEKIERLLTAFSPGPLTCLLPKKDNIPDLVTAGLPDVAVRIPNHPLALKLLEELPFPLAAPSANPFGYVSPTTAQHVEDQLGGKIDFILDGGDCEVGLESTIVGEENGQVVVYRLGGVSVEALQKVVGKVVVKSHSTSNPKAPGMLQSHYAPKKKIIIAYDGFWKDKDFLRLGYIGFKLLHGELNIYKQLVLSPDGDLAEAAQYLFTALRDVETFDVDEVYVELVPERGLGRAINDRLRRAAAD